MKFPSALDPIRSLQAAWKLLCVATGPLLLGGIILALTETWWGFGIHDDEHHPDADEVAGLLCCLAFVLPVCFLVSSWLEIGFARCVDEARHTGRSSLATLWDTRGRFGDMVLARLLAFGVFLASLLPFVGIVLLAAFMDQGLHMHEPVPQLAAFGAIVLYTPVFLYIVLGLSWVAPAVALEERHAVDALRRSWQLAAGHRLALFIFWLALCLFATLGFCCCCVGWFFTAPLTVIAHKEAFLSLTRDEARPILPASPVPAPPSDEPPPIYPADTPPDVPLGA